MKTFLTTGILGIDRGGLGKHANSTTAARFPIFLFAAEVFYTPCLVFVKFAVAALYLRNLTRTSIKYPLSVIVFFVVLWGISFVSTR